MKCSFTLMALVAFGAVNAAVDISGIPTCAISCIDDATASATNCAKGDYACSCEPANTEAITAAAITCISKACSTADLLKTQAGVAQVCASLPAAGETSTSAAAEVPTSTTAAEVPSSTAEVKSSTAATEAPATTETPVTSAPASVTPTLTTAVVASNATVSTSTPTAKFTGAAAINMASFGSFAAVGLAALAAL